MCLTAARPAPTASPRSAASALPGFAPLRARIARRLAYLRTKSPPLENTRFSRGLKTRRHPLSKTGVNLPANVAQNPSQLVLCVNLMDCKMRGVFGAVFPPYSSPVPVRGAGSVRAARWPVEGTALTGRALRCQGCAALLASLARPRRAPTAGPPPARPATGYAPDSGRVACRAPVRGPAGPDPGRRAYARRACGATAPRPARFARAPRLGPRWTRSAHPPSHALSGGDDGACAWCAPLAPLGPTGAWFACSATVVDIPAVPLINHKVTLNNVHKFS